MWLGLDLGTSGVKAIVLDDAGRIIAEQTSPLTVSRPHPLWSEQDPADWWAATEAAVLALPAADRARVQGIGIAGQMHGATLLGADDQPLRPAILWNDGRSHAQCDALLAAVPALPSIAGNIAMPGFTAPKLAWVRDHEPDHFARTRTVLLPKDWLRLRMTGEKASDMSDSAGTLWMDVAARDWSDTLLAATGLTRDHMPRLLEGPQISGQLLPEVAARWGVKSVPVVAGAGDNAAGAIGVGVVGEGDGLLSLGTSGVLFVATAACRPNPTNAVHAFCHCLPGLWHQMSVHLSAASCLGWAAQAARTDVSGLLASAQAAGPAAGPELFLPYLSGERTPHNDPHVRGAFLGLSHDSDPGRLAAAVLEGVAFAFADGLDALREAGTNLSALSVIGGGARSHYWGTILASVLGLRLDYLDGGEVGPALGAARLAAIGIASRSATEVCSRPPVQHSIVPSPDITDRLTAKRDRFRAAYPALRHI